jgi:hypothetical protein
MNCLSKLSFEFICRCNFSIHRTKTEIVGRGESHETNYPLLYLHVSSLSTLLYTAHFVRESAANQLPRYAL